MIKRAVLVLVAAAVVQTPPSFPLEEATAAQLQEWMSAGRYTSRQLTEMYLRRIEEIDRKGPGLHAVIEVNPDALSIADSLDAERRARGTRGPLHGIPVLIKDNIDTADGMLTTAGSLALEGTRPQHDAALVVRLREAGVVLLGKTNLSEWANFRSTHSTSGWSARGGQVKNPYALDRNPCGSSSGTGAAIAANLAAIGVGTETDGSIVCPSGANGLVGIKPTVGLVSQAGIVPISHSQDTAGPMGRTVADAALLLDAMAERMPRGGGRYADALRAGALQGARIGVARKLYFGYSAAADALVNQAIADMKAAGAVVVDPADIPNAAKLDACENDVLLYEFKADIDKYLVARGPASPVRSLVDLIAFDERERAREMPYFGQDQFVGAEKKGPLTSPAYRTARAQCRLLSRAQGIDRVLGAHSLDAIVAPTGSPAWTTDLVNGDHFTGASSTPAAVAGYPSITVPAGQAFGLPVGMSFIGTAGSEAKLIGLAYAYEQATHHRRAPGLTASAVGAPQ
ncbi:MAG TPA: amidase [Vicinamibacterales bacterium]